MSKEQTPITAEQYLNNKGFNTDGQHFEVLLDVMEQYAQAKVLEALEREVTQAFDIAHDIDTGMTSQEYYETEVKPKYKQ